MSALQHLYQRLQAYLPELLWSLSHPLKWLEQRPAYWRFRSQTKHLLKQILLTPMRLLTKPRRLSLPNASPLSMERQLSADDFYASFTLLPTPALSELRLELNNLPTPRRSPERSEGDNSPGPRTKDQGPTTNSQQLTANPQPPAAAPRVSLILVTYNNLALTHLCLMSLLRNTTHPDYELIVVDNHSIDETPRYLKQLAAHHPHLTLILNEQNYGFAHANNQGLAQATGTVLILLNNDTLVSPGWLPRLVSHLADPTLGLVGPVTNFAGNEARLKVPYTTWGGMETFALERAEAYTGQLVEIPMLAMYCLALRREVYEVVGPLDEQFGIGMFEDDDYAQRVRAQGYRLGCALDVFIHHVGQAAFGKLIPSGEYDRLFAENLRHYQAKWKVHWTPHRPGPLLPNRSDLSEPATPLGKAAEEFSPHP